MVDMVISVCLLGPRPSRPRWRPCARGRSARSRQGPKLGGGRRTAGFLTSARNAALRVRGKKLALSRCGKAIEELPSLGPDQPLEVRVGHIMTVLTERTLATATDTAHGRGSLVARCRGDQWQEP